MFKSIFNFNLAASLLVGLLVSPGIATAQCNCWGSPGAYSDSWMTIPGGGFGQIIEGDSVYITLNVPEEAIVQVNGDPTISIGPTRYFVVRNLEAERTYKFVIVVETANAAGVAMEETKTIKMTPGNTEVVTMKPIKRKVLKPAADASASKAPVKTNLTKTNLLPKTLRLSSAR